MVDATALKLTRSKLKTAKNIRVITSIQTLHSVMSPFSGVEAEKCVGTLFFLRSGDDFYKNFISSKAEGESEFFSGSNTTLLS